MNALITSWLKEYDSWKTLKALEKQNLFKNVSKWVTFLWQTQIQTIKYGLNDTTNYIDSLLIYTLSYEFSSDFDAQRDFGKNFVTKNLLTWTILILSML